MTGLADTGQKALHEGRGCPASHYVVGGSISGGKNKPAPARATYRIRFPIMAASSLWLGEI